MASRQGLHELSFHPPVFFVGGRGEQQEAGAGGADRRGDKPQQQHHHHQQGDQHAHQDAQRHRVLARRNNVSYDLIDNKTTVIDTLPLSLLSVYRQIL